MLTDFKSRVKVESLKGLVHSLKTGLSDSSWATYVCYQRMLTVAFGICLTPEINCPVQYVTPTGLGKREQGSLRGIWVGAERVKPTIRLYPPRSTASLSGTYSFKDELSDENSSKGAPPSTAVSEGVCLHD